MNVVMILIITVLATSSLLCSAFNAPSLRKIRLQKTFKKSIDMSVEGEITSDINIAMQSLLQHHSAGSFVDSLIISADDVGYSKLSLYFTLFLYVLSLPGLFSLVTRSVKTKPIVKSYDLPGPADPTAKPLRQVAGEIMAYFKSMNYEVTTAEDIIIFKGVLGRSNSQAAFLTFCTFMGLGSLALVISILFPDIGVKAYILTLLSPYAGIYYWKNAQRVEEVSIKMETSDDDLITSISAKGGKEDLERFSKTLNLPERGKVYVRGIFETQQTADS